MAEYRGRLCGELLIGASTIPGTYLLPALVAAFQAAHPQVRPTLRIAGSGQVVEALLQGELSIGLVGGEVRDQRLESRQLPGDELVLVIPPAHPWQERQEVAAAELTDQPFVLRERGSGTRQVMAAALRRQGVELEGLDVRAEMGSSEAVTQAVRAGLGIAIVSSLAVAEEIDRGTLRTLPIAGIRMCRPFYLLRRRSRELSPLAVAFCDHLLAAAGSEGGSVGDSPQPNPRTRDRGA